MLIKVEYFGLISSKLRKNEEGVELHEGAKISDLLEKLVEKYGESITNFFYVKKGNEYILQPAFLITHNGIIMIQPHGINTKLNDEDHVALLMTVSGG